MPQNTQLMARAVTLYDHIEDKTKRQIEERARIWLNTKQKPSGDIRSISIRYIYDCFVNGNTIFEA
jgi:hypothetical protein